MKIKEILVEKISTTSHIEELTDHITDISFNVIRKNFKLDIDKNIILSKLSANISRYLQKFVNDVYGSDTKVSFGKVYNDATGQYKPEENEFVFKLKLLHDLTKHLFSYEEYIQRTNKRNLEQKQLVIDDVKFLVKVILHELTHVIQLSASGKSYEKSYIKDYDSVNKILSHPTIDLGTKKKRKEYVKKGGDPEDVNMNRLNALFNRAKFKHIYYSQPEEIEAYAQEAAVDIIQQMDDMNPKQKINYITSMLYMIQHNSNNKNIPSAISTYSDIGKKYDPKVYHRYLKKLYQELDSYRSNIKKW